MDGEVVERPGALLALYDAEAIGGRLRPNRPHVDDPERATHRVGGELSRAIQRGENGGSALADAQLSDKPRTATPTESTLISHSFDGPALSSNICQMSLSALPLRDGVLERKVGSDSERDGPREACGSPSLSRLSDRMGNRGSACAPLRAHRGGYGKTCSSHPGAAGAAGAAQRSNRSDFCRLSQRSGRPIDDRFHAAQRPRLGRTSIRFCRAPHWRRSSGFRFRWQFASYPGDTSARRPPASWMT